MDMSFMAGILVKGPDAVHLLNRISVSQVDVPVGKIVYTQWLTPRAGIWTDLTVTRVDEDAFVVIGADLIQRRMIAWLERHTAEGERVIDRGHVVGTHAADGTGAALARAALAPHDRRPVERGVPLHERKEIEVRHGVALAMRVTYLGELGWELHVPTDYACHVYDALFEAGAGPGLEATPVSAR